MCPEYGVTYVSGRTNAILAAIRCRSSRPALFLALLNRSLFDGHWQSHVDVNLSANHHGSSTHRRRGSVSASSHEFESLGRCDRLAPASKRSQDRIEHGIEIFRDVFGKKADYKIAVLLQKLVLAPVATIRNRIWQVLAAIELNRQPGFRTQMSSRQPRGSPM